MAYAQLKHVGRHGDRKVCVLFREVPNESHMCLVIYPDTLPAHWEDAVMRVLESDVGQQAKSFADALHRSLLPDGRLILETLHQERMIKKIRTSDVIMTPVPGSKSNVRLDELNAIVNKIDQGQEAYEKLAQNDAARGLVDPQTKRNAEAEYLREAENKARQAQQDLYQPLSAPESGALSDRDIASSMLTQAQQMETQAKSLVAEAARMKKEAEKLFPNVETKKSSKRASVAPVAETIEAPKARKRGPKPKVVANASE